MKHRSSLSEVIQAGINLVMAAQDGAGPPGRLGVDVRSDTSPISIPTRARTHTHNEGVSVLINVLINQPS